jgi:hypothetical protein
MLSPKDAENYAPFIRPLKDMLFTTSFKLNIQVAISIMTLLRFRNANQKYCGNQEFFAVLYENSKSGASSAL